MRKMKIVRQLVLAGLLAVLLAGCAPKTRDALKQAEAAISEAESQSASLKSPEILDQAKVHLEQGREYEFYLRFNLARVEYEAAAADARLALVLSGLSPGMPAPQCRTCARCEEAAAPAPDSCCLELDACGLKQKDLKSRLSQCLAGAPVRTRVVREACEEPEPKPAMKTGSMSLLLGTLLVEPPQMIEKDKTGYKIKVRYVRSQLDKARGADDYGILLDIAGVDPPEVEVFSPTVDFEDLTAHGGEWLLPMTVPEDTKQTVTVKVSAILRNRTTGAEQTLPDIQVTIPDASSCPDCPECPQAPAISVETEKTAPGPGWPWRIIMLVIGAVIGAVGGFAAAKSMGGKGASIGG